MYDTSDKWTKIVNLLKAQKLTIATMESCTGGGIANEITNISGASSVLKESFVTYCNEAKIKQGVPKEVIETYTVYSQETAIAMAKAVINQADSDIAIGITGQLGRIDPNNPSDKVNCVWYAIIDTSNNLVVQQVNVPNVERKYQKEFVINSVATMLLEFLGFIDC